VQRDKALASSGCLLVGGRASGPVGRAMRRVCFAARTESVRDAFAWELAVVVLGDQCTSSAGHLAWSRNLLAGCAAEADDDGVWASASDGFSDFVVSPC
jgi:hypothetical protein